MNTALYSPEDVTILLGGIYQIEGLAEGSFITISDGNPRWKTSVTADGKVSRTHVKSVTHDVTITVMSTADVNNIFSAWVSADGLLYGAMLPLFIKDSMGTSLFYAPLSWVETTPDTDYDVSTNTRQWTIKTAGGTNVVGGNGQGGIIDTNLAALGLLSADFGGLF